MSGGPRRIGNAALPSLIVNVRQISTIREPELCDVCHRNLLSGERHDVFLHGGQRRIVCELCTQRATQQGWMRESGDQAPASGRVGWNMRMPSRSLASRITRRREPEEAELLVPPEAESLIGETDELAAIDEDAVADQPGTQERSEFDLPPSPQLEVNERAVRAVPTHADMKGARALGVFNAGPHPRTVASLARTLGAPVVSVRPSEREGSIVSVIVAWDLSWYRYEVDLADEGAGARLIDQGSELEELEERDRVPNAVADSQGRLHSAVESQ